MQSVTIPTQQCRYCGYRMDRASSIDIDTAKQRNPEIGDYTICFKCGGLLRFTSETLCFEKASLIEAIKDLDNETYQQLLRARNLIRSRI